MQNLKDGSCYDNIYKGHRQKSCLRDFDHRITGGHLDVVKWLASWSR